MHVSPKPLYVVTLCATLALPAGNAPVRAQLTADAATLELRVQAGQRLFFDARLSEPAGTSCASCHEPAHAFSGNNGSGLAVARGSRPGQLGMRNAPTLTYLANTPKFAFVERDGKRAPAGGFFWDGRADSFAEQVSGPLLASNEMNNASEAAVLAKVAQSDYAALMRRAWGDDVFADPARGFAAIGASLEAFQRSPLFSPFSSKFDASLAGRVQLSEQEARGKSLFLIAQKGNCAACHLLSADSREPRDSLFTDFSFHAIGVPRNAALEKATARPAWADLGLCASPKLGGPADRPWCGYFKTPSLRNVALSAPYMHNGQFATLREAVAFYATRDTHPERWYPPEQKFNDLPPALRGNVDVETRPYHRRPEQRPPLNDEEIDDIVAFLNTLTDGWAP
jgi:cytochrome c peroxidase